MYPCSEVIKLNMACECFFFNTEYKTSIMSSKFLKISICKIMDEQPHEDTQRDKLKRERRYLEKYIYIISEII